MSEKKGAVSPGDPAGLPSFSCCRCSWGIDVGGREERAYRIEIIIFILSMILSKYNTLCYHYNKTI